MTSVTEAVLAAGFEAATRVLVADDSSNGQDCLGVSAPEDVLKEFERNGVSALQSDVGD